MRLGPSVRLHGDWRRTQGPGLYVGPPRLGATETLGGPLPLVCRDEGESRIATTEPKALPQSGQRPPAGQDPETGATAYGLNVIQRFANPPVENVAATWFVATLITYTALLMKQHFPSAAST